MVVFLYPVPQDYEESCRVKGQCYNIVRGEVVGVWGFRETGERKVWRE